MVQAFSQRPIVPMKMIRYPPHARAAEGQFGIGAHTDFGGVTILFQQPTKDGLEVWDERREQWISVPFHSQGQPAGRHIAFDVLMT